MIKLTCLTLVALFCLFGQNSAASDKVVCYYDNWYTWRTDKSKFTVSDVDKDLCSHVVYGYLGVSSDGTIYFDKDSKWTKEDIHKLAKHKGSGKTLISIGGWGYSQNPEKKEYWLDNILTNADTFASDVLDQIKELGIDGITIDWSRDVWTEEDMADFVKVLKDLKEKFGDSYTLAVSVNAQTVRYDIKSVNEIVDFITVLSIDFHGTWDDTVEYAASIDDQLKAVNKWVDDGADKEKLIMSVPFYGHSWTLSDKSKTEPGSDAKGPGKAGPWTLSPGKLGFNEICTDEIAHKSAYDIHRDSKLESIYAVKGDQWISYEDPETLEAKAKTAATQGFGGVSVQALENDDFRDLCGLGKNVLLKAVNKGLSRTTVTARNYRNALRN